MSNVKNEPKYKNGLLQAIRAQLEHRAFWLYLLCDEAKKRGLDPRDFGSDAVKRCGLSQGADLVKKGGTDSLVGLRKTLFTKPAQLAFPGPSDLLLPSPGSCLSGLLSVASIRRGYSCLWVCGLIP